MKLAFLMSATAMNVINTNIRAQFAQAALSMVERRQSVAMERLSTGKRINSARDDAAGLAIAARMSELIRGTHQAIQNANNGIGMIQTAESAAGQIGDRLQRMRELAVQAANGTYSDGQRRAMDLEYQQLKQDIAAVSRNTRWNGMSLMDAKAGTLITPKALYKAVSAGQWVQQYGGQTALTGQLYDTSTSPSTANSVALVASAVNFSHKGKITIDLTGATPRASFVSSDGSVESFGSISVDFDQDSIELGKIEGLMDGDLTLTAPASSLNEDKRIDVTIDSSAELGVIGNKDLNLNGVDIGIDSDDVLDTVSLAGNAAASAITKAAQINRFSAQTGVTAVVNRNLMGGRAMTQGGAMTGTLHINGYLTAEITTSATDSTLTSQNVIKAINDLTERTGVKAIDTRLIDGGITLVAEDGRNIDVELFSSNNAQFGALIGVNQGVQTGTYSLAVQAGKGLKVASTLEGNLQHSGLMMGNYTAANVSSVVTSERAIVSEAKDVQYLHEGDLLINGVAIPAAKASDDTVSNSSTVTSSQAASGLALAAAVNAVKDKTGVTALVQPVLINGTRMTNDFNFEDLKSDPDPANINPLYINGTSIFNATQIDWSSASEKKQQLISLINAKSGITGVDAIDNGTDGISLKARDGRNVSVWYERIRDSNDHELSGSEFGLAYQPTSAENPSDLPGISSSAVTTDRQLGATFYAGVVLQSSRDIAIKSGPQSTVEGQIDSILKVEPWAGVADGDYVMRGASGAFVRIRVIDNAPILLDGGETFLEGETLTSESPHDFSATVESITPTYSRFAALGFTETDTSVISSIQAEHYQPPAVSRLDFQVGNRVGEKISIDMPDFGAQGSITHLVTWDVDQTYLPPEPAPGTAAGSHVISLRNGLGRTTLGQDIDAVTTTIPVRSTEGFPSAGTVYIDNELITYTGLTANSLTGVTRGAMNTTAQTHRGDAIVRKSSEALLSNLYIADPLAPPLQVGLTVEPPPSHLLDQITASNVLLSLDAALYQVNQARSNMGAVMNRLEYSVSNLYDTYTNMSASRSKIEDADYAAESSDMARAQIIQQAATAILPQANTNQQTVLKLLQ